ncbi:putative ribonuclease H-like domain-containing protein [Tanacetum coccineum]|uniref:Ribonuclease H-like domain-containing protein n=1 Tax=Tanacetum coccineum TaxID=301880 RepID=A0ABQ5BFP1_9ASTR
MPRSQDEIPPPPPPSTSQTPTTQQTPHTVSTIKLPILKKGEYDIWAMKMEHYLAHTDYPIWEVIQSGNGPVSITTDTQGQIKVLPPRTAEEILARERERKARTTLLMALTDDHLAKFHKMTDAKEMWDVIKSRFGGNDESKKMQKYILKQQFEGFSVSNSEGLHKGYDRSLPSAWSQVSLIMRTKPGVDSLSFDDLYNNLRVFENDVKGPTASSSSTQNVAFVSENTSSTNDVSTAYSVSNTSGQNSQYEQTSSYSLLANQSSCPQLDHEDLEQLDEFDLEEMDLKWQVAMISMRMKKIYKKTGRNLQFDAKELVGFDKTKVECYNCHKTGHFARECRTKGNQDSRRRDAWNSGNKDGRRSGKQEDSKALVTIDGEGVDWTSHSEEEEDYALMACNSSGSDTEVTSCSNECKESYAKLKKLYDAQREQLSDASIEIKAYTQGLKKVEAQLVAHQQEAQKEKEDLKAKVEKWHNSSKNLGKLLNTQMSANDKFGLGYGDHRYDGILSYENEVLQSVFMNKESELEKQPLYDRFVTVGGMHVVPPPMTGNYMPTGPNIEVDYSQFTYGPNQTQPSESETSEIDTCESNISSEPPELVSEPVVNESNVECKPKVWSDAPIIEEYESDNEDEYVSLPTKEQETPSFDNQQVKSPRETVKNHFTHSKNPKVDKKELGYGFAARACFVCGSFSHLIRDCDFHKKRMTKQAGLNNSMRMKSSQSEIRPIWNNVQRVNYQNQFVPTAVLTRTGKIPVNTTRASGTKNVSTVRHSFNRHAVLTNAAMKVNTVKPIVNRVRPTTVFHKTHSPFSKPFNKTTTLRTNFSKQKFNTVKLYAVSVVRGKRETTDYPHRALQNKGIVDSGCSRHMTRNKAYLAEYQDFNGGPVAFGGSKGYITGKGKIKTGKLDFEDMCIVKELQHFNLFSVSQMCDKKNKVLFTDSECLVLSPEFKLPDENQVLLRIPRQNNMYSFNLENIVPSGGLACLIAKATIDESNKWHRRLGHVNFKNLNKLVKGNLVRGLPSKIFQNDHTCVACQKGKQHKASCKAKSVSSISHSLQLLHMDLFGPTSVRSLNHKTYCLVITDDFSRFSWVFFLRTKDETSGILKDFIRQIENQLNQKVKTIRCDNGTEFKNRDFIEFCGSKGIKREYSNARTPQQNGVAERKNMTLIEAARTMLADSFLPNTFWAEAVSTACYVLNRVLVTKPHNKTPYELVTGKIPIISYIRPFGCHVTILNTIDHLGKFDGKTWLFDLDYLTDSMNYQPVRSENQANKHAGPQEDTHNAGTKDTIDAGDSEKEDESAQDYFVLPIWSSYSSTVKRSIEKDAGETPNTHPDLKTDENPVDKEDQVFLDELERLKRQEKDANDATEVLRKEFAQETEDLLLQAGAAKTSSTNIVNTASTPDSTHSPYIEPSFFNPTNPDQDDTEIPALEDIYQNPTDGIFTNSSYDDEGAVAEFTKLEPVMNVSPIPTSRINSIHPSTLILGDPQSAVQTRSKVTKSYGAHAFILVDLPYGKKAIGTKWVYRNKKDERGVVVRNKARLVAQGHRQEEGIDYDEVFAPVARIEAIRIFLAFASYMGFIVYQMDVRNVPSLWQMMRVYVSQTPGFRSHQRPHHLSAVKESLGYHKGANPNWAFGILECPHLTWKPTQIVIMLEQILTGNPQQEVVNFWQRLLSVNAKSNHCGLLLLRAEYVAVRQNVVAILRIQNQMYNLLRAEGATSKDHQNHNLSSLSLLTPSKANMSLRSEPITRLSHTPHIPDFIPEVSGGNYGGQSSSDKSLSGNEGTDQEAQEASQTCYYTPQSLDEECLLEAKIGRKEILEVKLDAKGVYEIEKKDTEDAQDVGRIRNGVNAEKKGTEDAVSTEDVVSIDKEKVSTDRSKVSIDRSKDSTDKEEEGTDIRDSTDKEKEGTDKEKEGTDKDKDSTVSLDEGTDDRTEARSATPTTPTTTPTMFGDDETIAQVLLNMSQAKAVSREKEKGVELKDVEETERPRPTSTRSLLTLKPLPKIDPKDKGKKKIEEEDESDTESEDIPEAEKKFKQLARDEEMARKLQEDWETEEERKRLAEEEATKTALSDEYDFIQARIKADRLLALRLQDEEREQFTVEERAKFLHDTIAAQRDSYRTELLQ